MQRTDMTHSARRAVAVLLLGTGLAAACGAQVSPLAPACPAGQAPLVDSTPRTLYLSAARRFHGRRFTEAQQASTRRYADAIRARFIAPSSVGSVPLLASWWGGTGTDRNRGPVVLLGQLGLVTRADGSVRDLVWVSAPFSERVAEAVGEAVRAADRAGAFATLGAAGDARPDDTLLVLLSVDTTGVEAPIPLLRVAVPAYVVDGPPAVVRQVPPEYPEVAERALITTEVETSFIIGSDDRMVPASLRFQRVDWHDFIPPVRQALLETVYRAPRSNGCRVPAFVSQSFQFRMR